MKYKLLYSACFAAIVITSCGENKQDQATNGTSNQEYALPSTLSQQQQTNSQQTSTNDKIDMQPVTSNELTINPTNANVKVNPPHGQPGHRCDIAVGAPLDGSVQPTTNTQPVTISTQPTTNNVQPTTKSSGKLNPAHGEPGHRCDIAVGAPLDGSQSTTNNIQTTTQPITLSNTKDNGSKTATTGNSKLNPPHGQPGHRCDIAVGAPLDGSTATKANVQTTDPKKSLQYYPTTSINPTPAKSLSVDAVKKDSTKN
jgi:hypothetical protein